MSEKKSGINAALSLLDCFSIENPVLGLTEICEITSYPKANAIRYLKSLQKAGLVRQDSKTKKYSIGYKVLELSYVFYQTMELREILLPYMQKIRDLSSETVCLVVVDGTDGVCIERIETEEDLKFYPPVGKRRRLYAGASRKLLLAYMPEKKIQQIVSKGLEKVSTNTPLDEEQLMKQLAQIREKGYAVTESEHTSGVKSVALPIKNYRGEVIASLSIVGPAFRISFEQTNQFIKYLKDATTEISEQLGYKK
jgi:IclR family transcriptional regulator, KDG regulon repressor